MDGRSCVNIKVEPHLTFTCMHGLSYIAYISFTHRKNTKQWKSTFSVLKCHVAIVI